MTTVIPLVAMRYSAEQKQQTHDRIVIVAARLFREHGYATSGVDAVMSAAGLTAGGFYAHFKNKDALLVEAIEQCRVQLGSREMAPGGTIQNWIDEYLSGHHRDRPGKGCPLPSLTAEIARQPKSVRKSFTAVLRQKLANIGELLPGTFKQRSDGAIEMLASVVGAMTLARAVDDEELSERILDVMRKALKQRGRRNKAADGVGGRRRPARRGAVHDRK